MNDVRLGSEAVLPPGETARLLWANILLVTACVAVPLVIKGSSRVPTRLPP